jgi:thioesterase domain-containing protein
LPATWLIEGDSLRALARRLTDETVEVLLPLAAQGAGRPLYLVPGVGGQAGVLRPLARGFHRPVQAFEWATGRQSIEEHAAHFAAALKGIDTPLLGGWSIGGVVAFETVRQLESAGHAPTGLLLLDSLLARDLPDAAKADDILAWLLEMHGVAAPANEIDTAIRNLGLPGDDASLRALMAPWRAHRGAHAGYAPSGTVACPVVFLQARHGAPASAIERWRGLASGQFRVMTLDADHFGLINDPATATVLEQAIAWIGDVSA